jgi:hypothetical protein
MAELDERPTASWMRPVHVTVATNTPFELPIPRYPEAIGFRRPIERAVVDDDERHIPGSEGDAQELDADRKRCKFCFVGMLFGRHFKDKRR